MDTGYSLSDIATATGRNDGYGWGDNSFMWIFALLILANGGFGWGGNRFNGNPVTEADLCNANSFSELKNSVGRLNDNLTNTYIGLQNGLCNLGYTNLENFNATQRQIADCCCTTQRGLDSVKFDMANYTASINANTTAQTQKILDAICQNKIEAQAQRINQLELQQAMCGVVRYPLATTYNAGHTPFANYGCSCCNGVNV